MKIEELYEIIATALEIESKKIHIGTVAEDLEEWDSLGHLSILVAVDEKLSGQISNIEEFAVADSVEKIVNLLKVNKLLK